MTPFGRALKYPLRHKRYLMAVAVCVLLGAICYGGGIGAIYPILQLIISPEGPHGGAQARLIKDMTGISLDVKEFSDGGEVWVEEVIANSPADKAGLKRKDVIQKADGQNIDLFGFVQLLCQKQPAEKVILTWVNREGKHLEGQITLLKPRLDARIFFKLTGLLPAGTENRFKALAYILIVFWVINLVQMAMRFLQDYYAGIMIERGLLDLRTKLYSKALHLSLSFYGKEGGSSSVSSRFVQDARIIHQGMNILFTQAILEPFKFVVALTLALICSWKLTIVVLTVAPIVVLLMIRFGRSMRKATRRTLTAWGMILGQLNETLGNIRVVKAYGSEGYERRRFFKGNRGLLKQLIRIARIDALTSPTVAMLGISMATLGILFACKQVLPSGPEAQTSMKPTTLLTFFGGVFGMAESLRKLATVPNKIQAGNAAAGRIFELMDQAGEKQAAGAVDIGPLNKEIVFEKVSFAYPGTTSPALQQINLVVPKGHTVALVGPNGSGKTTLVSLLPRFFNPDAGRILFDSQDIQQVTLRSIRQKIAVVTQQTVIFADTVRANIAYGQPRTPTDKIIEAAKKAHAHEFIELLPEGYDTVLTEGGENLSGGQRQRLNIARAILRDPEILILDEATSNIDADSEAKISQALTVFTIGRTCFIVAHRFGTVMAADSIVVMDAGRITASGTHEELMRTCPLYHGLYETQLQHSNPGGRA